MAGPRNRRLTVLLAAASFAVTAASCLISSCTVLQAGPDDDTTPAGADRLPDFCMGMPLSLPACFGISGALGFLLGYACGRVHNRFADGDEQEDAAAEMAGYVAIRDGDAQAAGGAKN